jgi:hypothetical protein
MFPEICKAIQHRRAEYYLLIHVYHYIEEMLKQGVIEDKDAKQLREEIDNKIFNLTLKAPEINLVDHNQRIIHYSELSDIFSREELMDAIQGIKFEERIYQPGDRLV